MEKDNDKVIKITKGKIKLAGLLLGLSLTAAGGYAISKSGSSEKEQVSVETEVALEDEIKTEGNAVLADEIIVEEISDDGIYNEKEIESIYFAAYVKREGTERIVSFVIVKEVSIDDVCAKNTNNSKDITYGEYYFGDDYNNIFGDELADNKNIKLYISIEDGSLINVINYKKDFKSAKFLSELVVLTDEELKLITPGSYVIDRINEVGIVGLIPESFEPLQIVYNDIIQTSIPTSISFEDLMKIKQHLITEFEYKSLDTTLNNLTEPDGYINYTKKR